MAIMQDQFEPSHHRIADQVDTSSAPASATQAAEGLPRRVWTVAEIDAMLGAGIIRDDERFELIGGEAVPMAAKGASHETVKSRLARHWYRALPDGLDLITETTLRVDAVNYREPDFLFWPRSVPIKTLTPDQVFLIVEVADSSLGYDLGVKAHYFASIGIPELWVIDAERLVIHVHRQPTANGYQQISALPPGTNVAPALDPALAVNLLDLGLQPLIDWT
jgi:Uma2 family endonuclease